MSIVVLSLAVSACSSSATPTPPAPTPTAAASAEASMEASPSAEASMEASPSAEASAGASAPAASLPASFPPATTFTFKGSKAGTSPAFDMYTPAQVNWTWSGKGPFNATIAPTGGINNISTGTIANTDGKGSGTTWIYGDLQKANYTITTTGTGDFNISVMNPVAPAVLPMPANLQGATGMTTQPVQISGDVTITYQFRGSGDWDVSVIDAATGASIVHAVSGTGSLASSTVVHALNGLYAFDVATTGQWSIMVAPLVP
jgi:hypothetical protein